MRALHSIPFFLIISAIIGCSPSYDHEEHKSDFPNKVWEKDKVLSFKPEIDSGGNYRILFDFRHVYGFATPELKLRSTIKSPSGETEENEHSIKIMETKEEGQEPEYLSDCSGDICDRTEVLFEEKTFAEGGTYEIRIQQANRQELPNVMEVGLMLQRNMEGEDVVIQKDAVQGR